MRKYINIIASVFILLSLSITSCKKNFLEVVPKGKEIAVTYDNYNDLLNGSNFYVYYYGGIWQPAMLMGDEIAADNTYFNSGSVKPPARALFTWSDDVFLPSSDPNTQNPRFLVSLQTNIYTCNKIINDVLTATQGSEQQNLELQAEALSQRAFIYFQLINYFGKPYTTATAATDPGWPIITVTEVTGNNFKRNTVQEVFDFMIKDLTTAIPNLALEQSVPTRMSKPGAEGLLGKIYMFKGDYVNALAMMNAAFNDLAKQTVPAHLYNYNATLAPGGSFLPIDPLYGPNSPYDNITDMTESVTAISSYGGPNTGNGYGNDFELITPQTMGLYNSSDWRRKFYTSLDQSNKAIGGGYVRKYGITYVRVGTELPDLYLLKAEAEARTNDLAGAKTDVEMLRKNRMPPPVASVPADTASNQTALIKFIIDERTREFAGEGHRWFDMRRLSTDPIFSGEPTPVHILYAKSGNTTYKLKPQRLTLRIPPYYLSTNPGMVDNP
jgi:hypothetical protein